MKNKILVMAVMVCSTAYAQQDSSDIISNYIEENFFFSENDPMELNEYLQDIYDDPVRINTSDLLRLNTLPFLSVSEKNIIINFIKKHSPLFSKSELYMIKDISESKIREIFPFISVDTLSTEKEKDYFRWETLKGRWRSRFRFQDINRTSDIMSWNVCNRISLESDRIKFGIITEKDRDEKKFDDLLSGFAAVNEMLPGISLLIGDFNLECGRGLLFGNPFWSDGISHQRSSANRFKPHTSSGEISFFRGAAVSGSYGSLKLNVFYSGRGKDAGIDDSGNIINFSGSGYHRTDTEMARRNSVKEKSFGMSCIFSESRFQAGTLFSGIHFSKRYFNKNNFKGYSFFSNYSSDNILFYNEAAMMDDKKAFIAGVQIIPVGYLEFETFYRMHDHGYLNFFGEGSGSGSPDRNYSNGFYMGLLLRSFAEFSAYNFQYVSAGDEFSNSMNGSELGFSAGRDLNKNVRINIKYQEDRKDFFEEVSGLRSIGRKIKRKFRGDIIFSSSKVEMKFRSEYVNVRSESSEKGFMIYDELEYKAYDYLTMLLKFCFFKTESFTSAIYEYESGIPGMMENRALYGEGMRLYTILKVGSIGWPVVYIKFSETITRGNSLPSEFLVQCEYTF